VLSVQHPILIGSWLTATQNITVWRWLSVMECNEYAVVDGQKGVFFSLWIGQGRNNSLPKPTA
jgi:hypothetical protein